MKKYTPLIGLILISFIFIINLFEREFIIKIQQNLGHEITANINQSENNNYYRVDFIDNKNKLQPDYLKLHFYFKPTQEMNLDNIFQTSDTNSGIRAELLGGNGGLVISDPQEHNFLRAYAFPPNSLQKNIWHKFELEAINGKYINATLDGKEVVSTWWSIQPHFLIDNILIGSGFSGSRVFNGEIKEIKLSVKKILSNETATYIFILLRFAILVLFLISICFTTWPKRRDIVLEKGYRNHDPLLILRAVACLMVLVGHGLMISFAPLNLPNLIQNNEYIGLLTSSPWGGVWVFFTLSGYLMGKAFFSGRYQLNKIEIFYFYKNRILRIVPIYWVAVLIVCIFNYPEIFFGKDSLSIFRVMMIDNHGMLNTNPIGALWSISTEMQFYLLVPFLYLIISSNLIIFKGLLYPIIFIIFGLLFRLISLNVFGWELWPYEVYKSLIGNLDLFVIGFSVNIILINYQNFKIKYAFLAAYFFIVLLYLSSAWIGAQGMLLGLGIWKTILFQYFPTLTALMTGLIIFLFEISIYSNKSYVGFIGKKLEIFGLLTYSIYVWHEPVFNMLSSVSVRGQSIFTSIMHLLLACIPLLFISWIMWKFIEIPFQKTKKFNHLK